jgi:hypothetical protein
MELRNSTAIFFFEKIKIPNTAVIDVEVGELPKVDFDAVQNSVIETLSKTYLK